MGEGVIVAVYFLVIGAIGAIAFYFAYKSRRTYVCPSCGEKIRTEYLEAERCSVCGTSLKQEAEQ